MLHNIIFNIFWNPKPKLSKKTFSLHLSSLALSSFTGTFAIISSKYKNLTWHGSITLLIKFYLFYLKEMIFSKSPHKTNCDQTVVVKLHHINISEIEFQKQMSFVSFV